MMLPPFPTSPRSIRLGSVYLEAILNTITLYTKPLVLHKQFSHHGCAVYFINNITVELFESAKKKS